MNEQKGVWRTICGRRVFIAEGQTLREAMQASGKFSKSDIKAASGKTKTKSQAVSVRTPSVSMRVPDDELYSGDIEGDEIRLPKNSDKPDPDNGSLPPPEQLKKLYGEELKGAKGKAALKMLLMERKGHVKSAATMTYHNNEIGVDYIWGNDRVGLKHLIIDRTKELAKQGKTVQQIKAHIAEILNNITEAIENGDATDGGNTKGDIEIDYRPTKTHLVIGRSYKGEKVTYVLTGFKRRKSKQNK